VNGEPRTEDTEMLGITYSCPSCGLVQVEAKVRFRESSEDVLHWMDQVVTPGLARDHQRRSPTCHPTGLRDVKIPVTGADWIGGPCLN
jgi:hypothetical protein